MSLESETAHWGRSTREAAERMGWQRCSACDRVLAPCPKGPGADEPGFCGYWPCACASEVEGSGE